ncbi:clathrin interactor EPSIN 2-like [Papaver somniferum]|uniref:clathrin interactor EPSIN 2-like n=1 Tax=Papaver somniferum TaxID=3469 RepID=UPI000E700614|nr:clathrin interactor EPSIN 2-like [Papaver somniferum]
MFAHGFSVGIFIAVGSIDLRFYVICEIWKYRYDNQVLDATSNEPWGPHGSNLSNVAQATKNYHEYKTIMAGLWKRINDTGKNWRHVNKVCTSLVCFVLLKNELLII